MAGDNDLGRQVTTLSTAVPTTDAAGSTSEVVVTTTQNIPDVSDAPSSPATTGAVEPAGNSAASRVGPAVVLAALAVAVAAMI